ncbi:hypothetical protein KLP40_02990 [Hymenobacter sp. NST-14]|uniref:hypothetical protein n=1 Tax=Hymenobacter piscis TaxID=2839984 RepID=UPI001C00F77B|nr:hypothetical protein [Hymenobacter piscis]MBT9392118.1 hypothetical protein [Hymenobacter piscis]
MNLRFLADLARGREPINLAAYPDSDHGVLFELPMALLARLVFDAPGQLDSRNYYLLRHGLIFLLCWGGLWALYGLARYRLRNPHLALLPVGLFVLSPRLFANSFYNAKDLLFLAAFTLGIYTLTRLITRPTPSRALLHGITTALAIDIRLLGVLLVPFTLVMLGLEAWRPIRPDPVRNLAAIAGAFLLAAAAATVAGWPYLWQEPAARFLTAFQHLSYFRWQGRILYAGQLLAARHLPWHYAPVWLLITTPVAYSAGALLGLTLTASRLLRRPVAWLATRNGRLDLLLAGWLLLPFLLVIGLHSVVYDGWRHLYFTYPALLLLATLGARQLWYWSRQHRWGRPLGLLLGLLAGLEMAVTAGRMIRLHPHQQVYFSCLTNGQVADGFERDYWGLAYRPALAYLIRRHPTGPIYVAAAEQQPLLNNLAWLATADRQRIHLVPPGPGRYYLLGYRSWPGPAPAERGRSVYTVRADGLPILSVLYLPVPPGPPAVPKQP